MALTSFGGMDPFAMMDPLFFDISNMGGLGSFDTSLGTATSGRRRAVMPADVMETPVRATAARCTRASRAPAARAQRARGRGLHARECALRADAAPARAPCAATRPRRTSSS